jgi:hypothetical protein
MNIPGYWPLNFVSNKPILKGKGNMYIVSQSMCLSAVGSCAMWQENGECFWESDGVDIGEPAGNFCFSPASHSEDRRMDLDHLHEHHAYAPWGWTCFWNPVNTGDTPLCIQHWVTNLHNHKNFMLMCVIHVLLY